MSRSTARKRAMNTLYEADIRHIPLEEMLSIRLENPGAVTELPDYARQIIKGVGENIHGIDDLIVKHLTDWEIDRLSAVDRNLLRMATWEIFFNPEVPSLVAIDEAMQLAKTYSDSRSPSFLRGVLSSISDDLSARVLLSHNVNLFPPLPGTYRSLARPAALKLRRAKSKMSRFRRRILRHSAYYIPVDSRWKCSPQARLLIEYYRRGRRRQCHE